MQGKVTETLGLFRVTTDYLRATLGHTRITIGKTRRLILDIIG